MAGRGGGVGTQAAPPGENRLVDHLDQPSLPLPSTTIIFTIIIILQNLFGLKII